MGSVLPQLPPPDSDSVESHSNNTMPALAFHLWLRHKALASNNEPPLYVTEMLSHHRRPASLGITDPSNYSLQRN